MTLPKGTGESASAPKMINWEFDKLIMLQVEFDDSLRQVGLVFQVLRRSDRWFLRSYFQQNRRNIQCSWLIGIYPGRMLHFKLGLGIKKEAKYDTPLSASKTCLQEMANNDGGKGKRQMSPCFCCCCLPSILLSLLFLFLCVSAGSPSRGGNVAVYVFDVNQPSLSTPFALFSRPFQSLWPFQLYFIP